MLSPDHFVVTLARSVELFRTRPEAVPEQKTALRALVALCKLGGVSLALDGDTLRVQDAPVSMALPNVPALVLQLKAHGVSHVQIAKDAAPAELLELVRGLAADPRRSGGADGVSARLRESRGVRVSVLTAAADTEPAEGREARVTETFEAAGLVERVLDPNLDPGPVEAPPAPPPPAAEPAVTDEPPAVAETVAPRPAPPGGPPLVAAMNALCANPYGGDVLGRVTEAANEIATAVQQDRIEEAVEAAAEIVRLDAEAPDGSPQRSYAIALRRLLTRDTLERFAQMLLDARHAEAVTHVILRAGAEGTALLLELLERAPGMQERRAYYDALRQIREGIELLAPMLGHREWYVAQSVAGLLGEIGVESAVPELAQALEHPEVQVRRAAAQALARIGGRTTVEYLRSALSGEDRELRMVVAGAVGGRKSGALAMPIVKIAEEDPDIDVRCECLRALGRIGTMDALQALIKAVQPGGLLLGRKPAEVRVAAIEGLGQIGGPVVIGTLEGLADDKDKLVREAARQALAQLEQKR